MDFWVTPQTRGPQGTGLPWRGAGQALCGHRVTFPSRLEEEGEGWCADQLCYYPWGGKGAPSLTFLWDDSLENPLQTHSPQRAVRQAPGSQRLCKALQASRALEMNVNMHLFVIKTKH